MERTRSTLCEARPAAEALMSKLLTLLFFCLLFFPFKVLTVDQFKQSLTFFLFFFLYFPLNSLTLSISRTLELPL